MKILIGIPTTEYIRHAEVVDYWDLLERPVGSIIMKMHMQSPAQNRNLMIAKAIELECSHIFFLDDDIIFEKDILTRLLLHSDLDVISGLYLSRQYPHLPIIFDKMDVNGYCEQRYLDDSDEGLIPVVAAGLGCLLIKVEIFSKLEKPYIRLGELDAEQWCDDIGFFKRLRDINIKTYCDLNCQVGHKSSVTIRPHKVNGKWYTSYAAYSNEVVTFPQVSKGVK